MPDPRRRRPIGVPFVALLGISLATCTSSQLSPSPQPTALTSVATSPGIAATATTSPRVITPSPTPSKPSFAAICGTIANWVADGTQTDGSAILESPGRESLKLTIPAGRLGATASGYVCVQVQAGTPYPRFDGFFTSGTPGFVDAGRVPASVASPTPASFVIPQACAYVAAPTFVVDQIDWAIDCGPSHNSDARGFLGAALAGQGWIACGAGLASAYWHKSEAMLGIAESSLAPGDHPRLTQYARVTPPCQ